MNSVPLKWKYSLLVSYFPISYAKEASRTDSIPLEWKYESLSAVQCHAVSFLLLGQVDRAAIIYTSTIHLCRLAKPSNRSDI
jgi:hypothetical protein